MFVGEDVGVRETLIEFYRRDLVLAGVASKCNQVELGVSRSVAGGCVNRRTGPVPAGHSANQAVSLA